MLPNLEFKEEFKGCPIIDPLEDIKYKCDAIHEENLLILNYLGRVMDKLSDMDQKIDGIYEFQSELNISILLFCEKLNSRERARLNKKK